MSSNAKHYDYYMVEGDDVKRTHLTHTMTSKIAAMRILPVTQ